MRPRDCVASTFLLVVGAVMLLSQPLARADDLPPPQQGTATGTIDAKCTEVPGGPTTDITYAVTIAFWNVGALGGDQYKTMSLDLSRETTPACMDGGWGVTAIFAGGPNGVIDPDFDSDLCRMRMVNGAYIELTWFGITSNIPIQNPEIFNGWVTSDVEGIEYQPDVDTGARFTRIQGDVQLFPDGKPDDVTFARVMLVIRPGTHILTGEESSVTIVFADLSTYTLPPNSEVVIKSFDRKGNLELIAGKIWANIKKIANGESIEVRTNQAVLGIKGTTFVLESNGDSTTLKMIEGSVSFTSLATDATQTVGTGEAVTADAQGLGQKTGFDVAAEESAWEAFGVGEDGTARSGWVSVLAVVLVVLGAALIVVGVWAQRRSRTSPG